MTATSGKYLPVGFRHAQIFALDANGYPAASSTTVYEGLVVAGPKAYELNIPDARIISHEGGDGVLDVDSLPPIEAPSGTLRSARLDYALYAALTNTKVVTLGEAKLIGWGTDQQGFEPELGALMFQQAHDEGGARVWRSIQIPKARVLPKTQGMLAQASDNTMQIVPSKVKKYLWGTAFTLATQGFLRAFMIEQDTQYVPWIVAWKGDNVATKFDSHADRPAVATTKIHGVWVNGVVDATATLALDGVTPTAKPGSGDMVVCFYEIAVAPEE